MAEFTVKRQIPLNLAANLTSKEVLPLLNMRYDKKWWPEVIAVKVETPGPVHVGTQFTETSKIWGPINTTVHATVVEYGLNADDEAVLALHGSGTALSYEHRYIVSADAKTLTWKSKVILPKFLNIFAGPIQKAIGKQLDKNLPRLKHFIEQKLS
jgi:hypothetical protein